MTAHAYIMPYKEWWQNMIEMIVSANFIIILVLRSTQSIVTYLTMFPGTSIPDSRGVQLAEPDKLTDFFGAFVYFPLGAALLMGVAWIVVTYVYHRCILFEVKEILFPPLVNAKSEINQMTRMVMSTLEILAHHTSGKLKRNSEMFLPKSSDGRNEALVVFRLYV